jgi:hypothetical protein
VSLLGFVKDETCLQKGISFPGVYGTQSVENQGNTIPFGMSGTAAPLPRRLIF